MKFNVGDKVRTVDCPYIYKGIDGTIIGYDIAKREYTVNMCNNQDITIKEKFLELCERKFKFNVGDKVESVWCSITGTIISRKYNYVSNSNNYSVRWDDGSCGDYREDGIRLASTGKSALVSIDYTHKESTTAGSGATYSGTMTIVDATTNEVIKNGVDVRILDDNIEDKNLNKKEAIQKFSKALDKMKMRIITMDKTDLGIEKVVFSGLYTIVTFDDGKVVKVKRMEEDKDDKVVAIMNAYFKHLFGSTCQYTKVFNELVNKAYVQQPNERKKKTEEIE